MKSDWAVCGMDEAFPRQVRLTFATEDDAHAYYSALIANDNVIDEVQRRVDAVVDAAVEWHQSGQEGDETWFDKAEVLGTAVDALLALRDKPDDSAGLGNNNDGPHSQASQPK